MGDGEKEEGRKSDVGELQDRGNSKKK